MYQNSIYFQSKITYDVGASTLSDGSPKSQTPNYEELILLADFAYLCLNGCMYAQQQAPLEGFSAWAFRVHACRVQRVYTLNP